MTNYKLLIVIILIRFARLLEVKMLEKFIDSNVYCIHFTGVSVNQISTNIFQNHLI